MQPTDWASLQAQWSFPTDTRFGARRLGGLPADLLNVGIRNPLIVTDEGLAKLPLINKLTAILPEAPIFSDVKPNPAEENVMSGLAAYRAGGHDGIVAFGGGSALDAAKAIALMTGQTRPIWDFEDIGDNWRRADTNGIAPVVAIPTTAGTGSEFGRASVITNTSGPRKAIIFHPRMMPMLVILDPELTRSLPAVLTVATGMDALSHALEAYCAPGFHPLADGIALRAMQMIKDYLLRAWTDGNDLEARSNMLVASAMGCLALQKGLGGIHALAHPLGAIKDVHHGMLNAVLMPFVLRHNSPALENRLDDLARWLDLRGPSGPDAVIDWTLSLRRQMDVPHKLSGIGITLNSEERARVVRDALTDPCARGNPVMLTEEGLRILLKKAA